MNVYAETFQAYMERINAILCCALVIGMGSYFYFLNQMITDGVRVESGERVIAELRSTVGDLDSQYLTLKTAVTVEKAKELGFIDAPVSHFVARESVSPTLTLQQGL